MTRTYYGTVTISYEPALMPLMFQFIFNLILPILLNNKNIYNSFSIDLLIINSHGPSMYTLSMILFFTFLYENCHNDKLIIYINQYEKMITISHFRRFIVRRVSVIIIIRFCEGRRKKVFFSVDSPLRGGVRGCLLWKKRHIQILILVYKCIVH